MTPFPPSLRATQIGKPPWVFSFRDYKSNISEGFRQIILICPGKRDNSAFGGPLGLCQERPESVHDPEVAFSLGFPIVYKEGCTHLQDGGGRVAQGRILTK